MRFDSDHLPTFPAPTGPTTANREFTWGRKTHITTIYVLRCTSYNMIRHHYKTHSYLIHSEGYVCEDLFVSLHGPTGTQSTHIHTHLPGLTARQVHGCVRAVRYRALPRQYLHSGITSLTCWLVTWHSGKLHPPFICEVAIFLSSSAGGNSSSSRKSCWKLTNVCNVYMCKQLF